MKGYGNNGWHRTIAALVCLGLLLGIVGPVGAAPAPLSNPAPINAPVAAPPAQAGYTVTGPYNCTFTYYGGVSTLCRFSFAAVGTSVAGYYFTHPNNSHNFGFNRCGMPGMPTPTPNCDSGLGIRVHGNGTPLVSGANTQYCWNDISGACDSVLGAGTYSNGGQTGVGAFEGWWSGSIATQLSHNAQCQNLTCDDTLSLYVIWQGVPTPTPTPTPTSTPYMGGANLLQDGNMEITTIPNPYWELLTNPIDGGTYWKRLFPGTNFLTSIIYGRAACGSGMQMLGYDTGLFSSPRLNPIGQTFYWPGGTISLRYSVRGRGQQDSGAPRLKSYIETFDGDTLYPLTVVDATPAWSNYTDSVVGLAAGTYRIVFDMHGDDDDRNSQILLDDVSLGAGAQSSACSTSGPTATPNTTRTPTPTRTPTATPTTGPVNLANCGFENGTVGWTFQGSSRLGTSGGPSGPAYAIADQLVSQRFTWTGGIIYVQAFVRGPVKVSIGDGLAGVNQSVLVNQYYPTWTLIQKTVYRPAGANFRLMLQRGASTISATADFDGAQLSAGSFMSQVCTAPTSTPTATVVATRTPNATRTLGPSPTVSRTPRGTSTPNATYTPRGTYTPRPSSTPRPTSTQSDAEKTATAQGTPLPTYTPYPTNTPGGNGGGGGGNGGTCDTNAEDCPVPPQPEPGPYADCERPVYFWQVAQWVDYTRCSVLSYFAWTETNTEQLVALGAEAENYEPFGTVAEAVDAVEAVQIVIGEYDWVDTGYTGYFAAERPELLTLSLSALANPMDFSLDAGAYAIVQLEITFCRGRLITVFSTNVAHGACVVWAFLHSTGIIAWIQFFFDLACCWVFVRYIWKRFLG